MDTPNLFTYATKELSQDVLLYRFKHLTVN